MATVSWKHTPIRVDQRGTLVTVDITLSGLHKQGGIDLTDRVRVSMFEPEEPNQPEGSQDTEKVVRYLRDAIRALQSK